jgi:hypothetical protein
LQSKAIKKRKTAGKGGGRMKKGTGKILVAIAAIAAAASVIVYKIRH